MPFSIQPGADLRSLWASYKSFVILGVLELAGLALFAAGYWLEQVQAATLGDKVLFYGIAVVMIGLMILRRPAKQQRPPHS